MERLADDLRKIHVDDSIEEANQVLFRPPTGSGFARTAFHEIPRYLFRVVTPRSDGITDETWARSELACQDPESSTEDVFFNLDDAKRKVIAQTLNLHLRWWPKYSLRDNFVSWTSSLLFAIQYIYYRHLNPKDGSSLEHIKLYAIDTTQFLRGTFLRDLDLIDFFEEFDDHSPEKNLAELHCRRKKDEFYFGEYLSQGALKIEGKCATISTHLLFESNRLRRLQRQFYELQYLPFNKGKPVWAQEVSRLRDTIWGPRNLRTSSLTGIGDRLEAVKEIIQDLDLIWRYPLAIYFTSLIGPVSLIEKRDAAIHNTFFGKLQSSFPKGQKALGPSDFKTVGTDQMPEIRQVETLVHEMYKYDALVDALDQVQTAEASIRLLYMKVITPDGAAFALPDENELLDRAGRALLHKLRLVQDICDDVILAIS